MTTTTDLRIYVASLSDYNAGRLHGCFIELDETTTTDEVWEQINAMLAASPEAKAFPQGGPAEEWAIHDHEGFGGYNVSEYASIETLVKVAGFLAEHGEAGAAFLANDGSNADLDEHDLAEAFSESYVGTFSSEQDYAEDMVGDCGFKGFTSEQLDELSGYLDWDAITADLMQDGWSAKTTDYDVMIFRSH